MIQVAYVIFWWLVLMVIGLISFPLVSRVCGKLPDKGYSISKLVGLVLLTFLVWMISSLKILPFGYASILISFFVLAALSLYLGRGNLRIADWPRKQIIISESIFTVAFVVFLLIVREQPDIYFKGASDALLNNAFIQSIMRGGYFPPLDPWFAGESIPYYYGEHVLVATLSWITRVPPTIAFNIAIAMFAALAVCASYGLGYNITKRKLYGFLAAVFVCIAGFTSGAFQLTAFAFHHEVLDYSPSGATNIIDWLLWVDFFHPHWLIDGAIVHYPYSAFLMGDLHSYSVSPAFQLMFIMLIFALFQRGRLSDRITRSDTLLDISLLGVCLGFFFILNTWEYPTYIIFTILAFILLRIRPSVKATLAVPAAIVVLSFILYLPYYLSGGLSSFQGLGLVTTRVSLAHFVEFGALFLFAAFSLLFILSKRKTFIGAMFVPILFALLFLPSERQVLEQQVLICALCLLAVLSVFLILSEQEVFRRMTVIWVALSVLLATILATVLVDFELLVLVVPMGLLSLYYIWESKPKTAREFILLLLVMSAALAFFCDFIYIDDALSVPHERFNTAMKVYLQLWVFFGISAACALFYVMNSLGGKRKVIWTAVLAVLVLASLIHPIATTTARLGGRYPDWGINRGTLDGMAYIEMVDKGDYDAIHWINKEIEGSPVILEASWVDGTLTGRISSFTGLPTILGWRRCELMWGHSREELEERNRDMDVIYNTVDNSEALHLLRKYDVEYIYIGNLERDTYEKEGMEKFASQPEHYTLIYEGEGVTIYEVRE